MCDVHLHDQTKVNAVRRKLDKVHLSSIARQFKTLGDENRMKIVYVLCQEKELCVCDLSRILGTSMATTSHHLRTLLKQAIVQYRKEGKLAFYSLNEEYPKQLLFIALAQQQEVRANG